MYESKILQQFIKMATSSELLEEQLKSQWDSEHSHRRYGTPYYTYPLKTSRNTFKILQVLIQRSNRAKKAFLIRGRSTDCCNDLQVGVSKAAAKFSKNCLYLSLK